jgi:trimeric autotransporter adhesin
MPGFSDSAWKSGIAEFGFGTSSRMTPTNMAAVTTYFRSTFDVANPAMLGGLRLDLLWDDGAAVYLNGMEVFRNRLSANAGFSDFATSPRDFISARDFESFMIDPHVLVPGTNTIAVETHVASGQSDMSFNLRLIGFPVPEPATVMLLILAAGGWYLPWRSPRMVKPDDTSWRDNCRQMTVL